jgi:hypothetical protein
MQACAQERNWFDPLVKSLQQKPCALHWAAQKLLAMLSGTASDDASAIDIGSIAASGETAISLLLFRTSRFVTFPTS